VPPTIFFFVGFNLVLFTKRLFLVDYLIQYAGFLVATTSALVVGKVVLVAEKMPILRRFDGGPLVFPILYKTIIYTALVFVARLLEALVHYLIEGGGVGHALFVEHMLGEFSWAHFIAVQLWIFVLFLGYVTATELNELLGDGELSRIMFRYRSSEVKVSRRKRLRALAQLSRLTERHPAEVLRDPTSEPHAELDAILNTLLAKNTVGLNTAKRELTVAESS